MELSQTNERFKAAMVRKGFDISSKLKRSLSGKDISLHDEANLNLGVFENSQRTDTKDAKRKPGKRGRSRVIRTHSIKEVIEDAKGITGEDLEDNESADLNGHVDDSVPTTVNRQGESSLADKGEQISRRKRNRLHTSQTACEQDPEDDSEGHSYSAAANGSRKRRQKLVPAGQDPPVERRYNLRQPRVAAPAAETRASSKGDGSKGSRKPKKSGAALVSSREAVSENGESVHLSQFETSIGNQDIETSMIQKVVHTTVTVLSDEVTGTPAIAEAEEGYKTESLVEDESEDDEHNEESMRPGEVSIGKKVWTFFTT